MSTHTMPAAAGPGPFGAQLKSLRETAGFTQEELAAIAGVSVHAISALERGERRRPQVETVRALAAALELPDAGRTALMTAARPGPTRSHEWSPPPLPEAATPLVGRESELDLLTGWLIDDGPRLVTLVGPGGVGKTRLALELARAMASRGSLRVAFVPLASTRETEFVASAIGEALGLSGASSHELCGRARAACERQPTLIVLDNFEQVLAAAHVVGDLLTFVPSLRVVVTSRAPLHVRGERQFAVGPLALDGESGAGGHRSPAVRLFAERVRDIHPGFEITDANGRAIAAICRRLDALPLALELAAPWMKVLTAEGLLVRLERDPLLSHRQAGDRPARQQTMNATVAWSYHLLDPDEQQAFRRIGVLPGTFPIDAVEAVLGGPPANGPNDTTLRLVASLLDKCVLQRAASSVVVTCPLYYMLDTIRAFALAQLGEGDERDHAMEGLVRYCTGEARLAADGLVGPEQAHWLDRVREDLESYRAVLTWLLERGRGDEAATIASALTFFWVIRGHASEGLAWYDRVLGVPNLSAAARSATLLGVGMLSFVQGDVARARASLLGAAGDHHTDPLASELARVILGHVEHATGDLESARTCFATAAERLRPLPTRWGAGQALLGLAWVALASGECDRTEHLLDDAEGALQEAGPWFLELGLYMRAVLAVRRGDAAMAVTWARESLSRIRELDDRFALVYVLVPLAAAAILDREYDWAARILCTRQVVKERTGALVADRSVEDLTESAQRAVALHLGLDGYARALAWARAMSVDALLDCVDRRGPVPKVDHQA